MGGRDKNFKVFCKKAEIFQKQNLEKRVFSETRFIWQIMLCNSTFTVYLATCKKCTRQYVGKSTQRWKQRNSGHKQEIKLEPGGLGRQYGGKSGCSLTNCRSISGGAWG